MPRISPERAHRRASLAGTTKAHGADSPEAREAKAELVTCGLVERIQHVADTAPPLTPEQKQRIIAVLMTVPGRSR